MDQFELDPGAHRCPGPSTRDIILADGQDVPEALVTEAPKYLGSDDVSYERYYSREIFDLEMKVQLSTRPEKSLGREDGLSADERASWDKAWENAEAMLHTALTDNKLEFELNPGDGAFYGPKLDFQVKDALGRWFQLGTIQLDYGLPRRFGLSYTNEQSGESTPVVIHRAVLGSLERFIGILLEHTAGDLPLWLAPVQVRVITINDELLDYGREVTRALEAKGIRVHLDERSEKLGFKIRDAELNKIPIVMVLGAKERDARAVSIRWRKKGDLGAKPLDEALALVLDAAVIPTPKIGFNAY